MKETTSLTSLVGILKEKELGTIYLPKEMSLANMDKLTSSLSILVICTSKNFKELRQIADKTKLAIWLIRRKYSKQQIQQIDEDVINASNNVLLSDIIINLDKDLKGTVLKWNTGTPGTKINLL